MVKAEVHDLREEGIEGEKKKKRRKRHKSGTSTKRDKKKRRLQGNTVEEEPGAGSTGTDLQDPTVPTEEKDQLVADRPRQFELRPAPKGSVAHHFRHYLPPPLAAPKRPRSPDHPPPDRGVRREGRGQQRYWRGQSQPLERAPQRKRGAKGIKHRERGRYWPYQRR